MSYLDTFLAGRGDDPETEVRLMAAELRRARRTARRCTDGPRGRICDAYQCILEFLDGAHGGPVLEVYVGYAIGRLVGEGYALAAALALRGLLADLDSGPEIAGSPVRW